ncbi:hypothetical protein HGA13_27825 [Nocardia speluncae]|uniref:Uncharacterized protein n=1 Tax=Nocardia speluncae TaxID=419477 RepID=A0A846XQ59_9NOCA|nr:hypothetical protein [Nocardia speluncae]NKY36850.1 hypothetical protein [Nocardia speluncae]
MQRLDPRRFGLICAAAALVTGATLAGCANQIEGVATPNAAEATAYRSFASSSSAAATSSQIAAARDKAIADNCGLFPGTTGTGVTKYNEFVDAHDSNAPDYDAKRDAAVTALDNAADQVEGGMNAAGADLPDELKAKFADYVDAARALSRSTREMNYASPVGPLNDASKRVNDARNAVRDTCPG